MEKSYLRRPLAALLSLLMVIGMFTVCGFGVLADGETVGVTLKTWSVDELDAAAQATGTKNYLDGPIYHKTDYIIGAQRVDTSADGNWLFHSQGVTNNDNNKDGTPDYFKAGDTLRVIAYLNGDLGSAGAWGRIEVAYNNDANLTTGVEFTPDVIANMGDAVIMGVPVKVFTMDIELDDEGYSAIGQLMQSRIWVNGGATLACYGVEYINVTTNSVLWGLELNHSKDGSDENSTFITVPALATYSSRPEVIGNKPEADRVYTSQDFEGECNGDNNNNVNAVLFKGLNQTLQAGQYTVNLDFATRYALGEKKFTFNVYAGDEQIFTKEVQHTADIVSKLWSPDSGIGRVMSFDFEVSEENSGKDISFEIVCHNQTDFILREMSLSGQMAVGDALAQWDYKDLLNASDRSEMSGSWDTETDKAVVGIRATQDIEGAAGTWMTTDMVGIDGSADMTAGTTIRFTLKMLSESARGYQGQGPFMRVYGNGGALKIVDESLGWDIYKNAPLQYDPVYGYAYKEINYEVTLTEEQAASTGNLHHLFALPGCTYSTNPITIYSFSAAVADTGKVIYTITPEQLSAAKNADKGVVDVYASPAGAYVPVGYRATDDDGTGQVWSLFNLNSSVANAPVNEGDVLELGVDVWVDNGYDDTSYRLGLELFAISDAQTIAAGINLDNNGYNSFPTQYNADYGYAYKRIVHTYTVTAEKKDVINAQGIYPLIGTHAVETCNYDQHPLTVYRYYVYNRTQNAYYVDLPGYALFEGTGAGSGTINEIVYAFNGNPAYATGGSVNENQNITFDSLTSAANVAGQYAMNFNVTGEQGAEYTLTAYSVDGETVSPVGSKTFTASGSGETVQVAFNVRDSLVGKNLTFGITTNSAKLDVANVSFEYLGALAADYTWDVADIAAASLDENMTYEFTDTVVVGAKINAAPWEIFFAGSLWTGDLAGVQAGDTLRMEVDMGTDQPVTDRDPTHLMASLSLKNDNVGYTSEATTYTGPQYNALELKADPDFGYLYRTLTATITLPADNDELMNHIATEGGFNYILDNCQTGTVGRNIYRAAIVNERTGETIFEIKGDEILPHLFNTDAYPSTNIEMVDGQAEFLIGGRVYDDEAPQDWWGFTDYYIPALDNIEDGMTLRVGAYVYYPEGGPIANGTGFTFFYEPTPGATGFGSVLVDAQASPATYEAAEELWNDEYGYAYKDQYVETTVPEGAAEAIAANGIKCLMGAPNNDFIAQPMECYGFYLYDAENEVMLFEADGAALYEGSYAQANLKRDPITVTKTDTSKASAVVFSEGATGAVTEPLTVTFADLGLTPGVYSFNVVGDENIEAQAMIQLGDYGDYYTIGTEPFVVTEDILDAPIGFVLQKQAGATAKVSSVELVMERGLTADDTQSYEESFNQQNQAAADPVIASINALPETITLADEDAVVAARTAFDALTASQKALVTNIDILETAEDTIESLKNMPENVANVIAMINALPEASAITEDDRADVEAARAAYNALTDDEKALVDADVLAKLEAAEAALPPIGDDITYGDVNDDGKVDAADALQCLQHSVELIKLEGDAFTAANVDLDDDVDASDALYILQFSVELIDTLPVQR